MNILRKRCKKPPAEMRSTLFNIYAILLCIDYNIITPLFLKKLLGKTMRTPAHDTPLGRLMTERQLSQSFLAREAGVTQSFVNRVAKGTIESPRRSSMLKVAAYLDVHVDTIYPD